MLRRTFEELFIWSKGLPRAVAEMRDFYMTLDADFPKMKDGNTLYPQPGYDKNIGMSVEFRCVTSVACFFGSIYEPNACTEMSRSTTHPRRLTVLPCQMYLSPFNPVVSLPL